LILLLHVLSGGIASTTTVLRCLGTVVSLVYAFVLLVLQAPLYRGLRHIITTTVIVVVVIIIEKQVPQHIRSHTTRVPLLAMLCKL
jgi:Na+-translocating ferredoxin:NAD+ oxidoreductase RnfA subunit